MNLKKYHKYLGFIMLLPFVTWAITGVFFFIKPGYSSAYEKLSITTYPLVNHVILPKNNQWSEIKVLRSVVGEHLLVKSDNTWSHRELLTTDVAKTPNEQDIRLLINDAIKNNPDRYGEIVSTHKLTATTSTDVTISLDWDTLRLKQIGQDTKFIKTMYQIHYLQWTGIKAIDNVLGMIGLALVLILAFMGMLLSVNKPKR